MEYIRRLFACAAGLLMAVAAPSLAGTWAGKEVTKEGVIHVINPATPSDGSTTLTPREAWRAGGDEEEDVLFGVLNAVDIDDQGNVYALDMQLSQVNVFDKDGNLLRTIGREGEGPGEFRRPAGMFLTPEGNVAVLQAMPGKLVLLSPDGKPAGDFQGPKGADGGSIAFFEGGRAGNSVVLNTRQFARTDNKFSMERALLLVSTSGQTRATLFHEKSEQDAASMMKMDEKDMRRLVWAAGKDGRIYTSENFDAYEIRAYSPDGKLERVIGREYTHRARTPQEMEENKPRVMMRMGRGGGGGQRMQPEIKSSATDRDIIRMLPREDGSLWVLTSKGANGQAKGTMATFDVFDGNGHFVRTIAFQVPGDFKQDEFHIVREQLVVVRSIKSARDAFMGGEEDEKKAEEDVEPVTLVAFRFDTPATARK